MNGEQIAEAYAPMSVTMTLEDEIDTSRGDMIVRENNVPEVGQDLEVLVTWMSSNPLQARTKVVINTPLTNAMAMVKELKYKVDINTLHRIENIDKIEMNDIGVFQYALLNLCFMMLTKEIDKQEVLLLLMNKPMKLLVQG